MKGRELLFIIKARNAARAVLNQFRQNLKGIGTAAKAATANFNAMGKSVRAVGVAAKRAAASLKGIGNVRGVKQATAGFRRMRQGIANTLKEALTLRGVLAGFGAAFVLRGAFNTLVGFSDEMAKVRAISGATEDQFRAMSAEAARLGTTTRFTAIQAAEGMTFLSRAGFTAEESIQAIGATLNLAQAGALDLGKAADIVSNVMSAFGIEATRTSDAVDVLAVVANNSNTSIEQLGDAMKFAAPLAAALGLSMQETAAAIGALGQAGIQGGSAGAGLQIFISKLVNLKESSREAFEAAGVNIAKISPLTNSLGEILDALADSSFGAAEAVEAFGARGLRTVLSLLKQRGVMIELEDKTKNASGAAEEFARIMDDQLGGAVKAIISAFQGLVIALGKTGLINIFEGLIRGIGAVVRAIASFLTSISDVVTAIPGLTSVLKGLGVAIGVLVTAGGIPLLIGGFVSFVGGAGLATTAVGGFMRSLTIGPIILFGTALKAGIANLIRWTGVTNIASLANIRFSKSFLTMLNPMKLIAKGMKTVRAGVLALGIAGKGSLALGALNVTFGGFLGILKSVAAFLIGPFIGAFTLAGAAIGAVVAAVAAVAGSLVFLETRGADTAQGTVTLSNVIKAAWEGVGESISSAAKSVVASIADLLPEFLKWENAAANIMAAWESVKGFFADLTDDIAAGFGSAFDFLVPEGVLKRAAELTKVERDLAEQAAKTGGEIKRLGDALTAEEKALAELGKEFGRVKDDIKTFIALGNPMVATLKEQERTLKKVGDLNRFTDAQLKQLNITRSQIPAILARSKQAMEDELRPLRLLNIDRGFEITLIGKSKLAIAQETLVRENRLAVFRGEQLADAKRLAQAKALLVIQAQSRAAAGGGDDIVALKQKITLIGLEGVALRQRQLEIKIENALRKEGVSITGAQRRALLALQAIQAQDKFNQKIKDRLADLALEADLIGLTGAARSAAAAQQGILNEATRKGLDLTLANAQATAVGSAIILNSQKEFRAEFEESLRQRGIEAALIGRSTEEVERLEVAMEAMQEAKRAGFSTKEIQEFGRRAVEAFDQIKEAQDKFQSDGLNGFRRAMDDYIAETKRFADQYEELTKGAINKVEDAFGDFVTGQKVNFKDLITSIADDLARLGAKQITGKLLELFNPQKKEGPGDIAGKAGELLGPDAQEDPIVKATREAADRLRESGGLISVELKVGAEKTKIAFDLVKQATESAAQISADAIRMSGQELADAIRSAAESVREAGQATGRPGDGPSTEGLSERADIAREAESIFGDAPLITEEDLAPLKENIAFQANAFGSIMSASNDNYAKAFTDSVDGFGLIAGEWTQSMGGAFDGVVGLVSSLAQSIFGGASGGGGKGGTGSAVAGIAGSLLNAYFSGGAGGAFAKGGVMSARGAHRLRHYADGGVANQPQLAVFGEGDQPEAFVPLPDGRRIPVEMSAQPAQRPINVSINQTITTPNPAEFGRNQDQIARKGAIAFQRAMARDN